MSKDDSILDAFCLSVSPYQSIVFCSQVCKSINARLSQLLLIMDAGRLFPCPVCEKGVTWRNLHSHYASHFEPKGIKDRNATGSSVEVETSKSIELHQKQQSCRNKKQPWWKTWMKRRAFSTTSPTQRRLARLKSPTVETVSRTRSLYVICTVERASIALVSKALLNSSGSFTQSWL